jgi:hypothetical protein
VVCVLSGRAAHRSAAGEVVSLSFHILFVTVIIDYIFHYHGYRRLLAIVCLLTVKIS